MIHICSGDPCQSCGYSNPYDGSQVYYNGFVDQIYVDENKRLTLGLPSPNNIYEHQIIPTYSDEDPQLTQRDIKKFVKFLELMTDDNQIATYLTSSSESDRRIGKAIVEIKDTLGKER